MRATFAANLILLDLITLVFGEAYNHDAPRYAVFSSLVPSTEDSNVIFSFIS
jgi:hypothetical protein